MVTDSILKNPNLIKGFRGTNTFFFEVAYRRGKNAKKTIPTKFTFRKKYEINCAEYSET